VKDVSVMTKRYTWEEWLDKNGALTDWSLTDWSGVRFHFEANEPYTDHLETLLKEAVSVIEFYGDINKWVIDDYVYDNCNSGNAIMVAYDHDDEEDLDRRYRGGKRARTFLQENKDAIERLR